MNTIKNNLAIFQRGQENKQSIVFIHGFPFDHKMWDSQIEYFSKRFHCVCYDVRGLGESPAGDGQLTLESFVDDLFDLIDALSLNKPILCGLSMGGYIALRAVERDENKFSGLILCDTKAEADTNEGKINRAKAIKDINYNGVEKFAEDFVVKCFAEDFINNHKEKYEAVLNRAKKLESIGVKGCLLAMAGRTDTTSYLSQIKIPVLLLCGEFDQLTSPDVMMAVSDKIIHSEFVLIPKAGHVTAVENPKLFNSAVEKYLKNI